MSEFWSWAIIVTLLIVCIMVLSFMVLHLEKRLNQADVMLLRLEEKEKRRENPRIDPKPTGDDGGL